MNHKKIGKSLTDEDPKKPGIIRGINRLVRTRPLPDLSGLVHFFANRGQERPLKVGVKAKHY